MATTVLPSIRTYISGEGMTALDSTSSFTLSGKLEATRLIKSTDGEVAIDFSFIDTVKTIYFQSEGTFTVKFTVSSEVIEFEIANGVFRLDPSSTFRSAITSIAISTDSTTDISVDIRIYGVSA